MATTVSKKDKRKKDKKRNRMPGSKPVDQIHYHGSTALYGRSGTGKTTLSATWPKPILYFNVKDNGTDSIRDLGKDIDVKNINSSEEWDEAILWCYAENKRGKLDYKTIVVDTMTQLQGIHVNEVMAERERKSKKLPRGKRPGDFGTLQQQDWGIVSGLMKKAIEDVRGLPVESVFIAQEKAIVPDADEHDDGVDVLLPEVNVRLIKSVAADLNASVSIIGNTFIRVKEIKHEKKGRVVRIKKQYCLRIGPNEVYTTKVRKPKGIEAPDYIVDPSHAKLMAIVEGKV